MFNSNLRFPFPSFFFLNLAYFVESVFCFFTFLFSIMLAPSIFTCPRSYSCQRLGCRTCRTLRRPSQGSGCPEVR